MISILFMIVALNLRFKAEQSEKEAIIKQEVAVRQTKIAEERQKEAIALQFIAKQQQDIAEQNRLIAEKQKQYAVAQQKEAIFQKRQAVISKNDSRLLMIMVTTDIIKFVTMGYVIIFPVPLFPQNTYAFLSMTTTTRRS